MIDAIVDALATAPSHQLNTRTIARKLGVKPTAAYAACDRARQLGLVERAHPKIRETRSETTWMLAKQPQPETQEQRSEERSMV